MFVPESTDDAESELDREFLANHWEWQGAKAEQKCVEERAGNRDLTDMAGDVYLYPNTSIHHVFVACIRSLS